MASLTSLTRLLSLSDAPAQAHKVTRRPTLAPINTNVSATLGPQADSDSDTPFTPVFLSAFPSPASEGAVSPVFPLSIPVQTFASPILEDSSSDGTNSEPTTPGISVISPQSPLSDSVLGSPWIPGERDQLGYVSPKPLSPQSPFVNHDTTPTRRRTRTPSIGPFKFLRSLNKGAYGIAYATRDLASDSVICTKVFSKECVSANRHRGYLAGLMLELVAYKQIAKASANERKWLMELHGALQDEDRVLFAMDLMQCDLFSVLELQIPRPTIRRWVAQIALGIDALHGMGIIHRDIKPENILICPDGKNVRIADFTNAYLGPLPDDDSDSEDPSKPPPSLRLDWCEKYSKHCIGTAHYLAPEVVEKKWYGLAVDYWALGCVLYDLLVGDVLFPRKSTMREFLKWHRDGLDTADYFETRTSCLTEEEKHLLSGLLCVNPDSRHRIEHLQTHPYFFIDDDQSTFDYVRSLPAPNTRPGSTDLTHQFADELNFHSLLKSQPVCRAKPESCSSIFDVTDADEDLFGMFAWVNPNGIWGVDDNAA